MPVESAADRASFLSADEFATPARYTAPGGGAPSAPFAVAYDRGQAKERFVAKDLRAVTAERSAWINADDVALVERHGLLEVGALDGAGALVVTETLKVNGLPTLDETGFFWFVELLLVEA